MGYFFVMRNQIIQGVYNDKQYLSYCKRVCKQGDLYNDLFQYVVLYLLEMPELKLIELHESGNLRSYIARIIYINANSERSEFRKQYRSELDIDGLVLMQVEDYADFEIELKLNHVKSELTKEINECTEKGVYPASVKLLEMYAETGSFQEVANRTNIHYRTVYRHINSLIDKIKKGK